MDSRATKPITVAVLFGGRSNEHSVSCVSAGSILAHLDSTRFSAIPVGITRDGQWTYIAEPGALAIDGRELPEVTTADIPVALGMRDPKTGTAPLIEVATGATIADIDVVFPAMHGPFGEDGTVAGLLEVVGVPYVGPGVLAGAAGMDKEFTKKLLAAEGLPVGDQVVLRPGTETLTDAQRDRLGLPVFVKPARGGSSIGISRVADWANLSDAIAKARLHDPKVVIEAGIVGREVECGVLQFPDGRIEASALAEIVFPETTDAEAFYDFDTKYIDDVCGFELPAQLDDHTVADIHEFAKRAFVGLDCKGLARVDFFVTATGPVINEINTMPGFTAISMYPKMWEQSGVLYPDLIATLIDSAVAAGNGLR